MKKIIFIILMLTGCQSGSWVKSGDEGMGLGQVTSICESRAASAAAPYLAHPDASSFEKGRIAGERAQARNLAFRACMYEHGYKEGF